jgi:hypothetical protein
VTPLEGGWVKGQKRTGFRFIFCIWFIVLLRSPHQETPKNAMQMFEKKSVFEQILTRSAQAQKEPKMGLM